MNNWFQYNKQSIITGGVGFLLFLGIAGLGINLYLEEGDLYSKIQKTDRDITSMASKQLPPTDDVVNKLNQQTKAYVDSMGKISEEFAQFKESSVLTHVDPQSFQNALKSEADAWQKACAEKGIAVANEAKWMGFESYRASAPIGRASTMLNFQKAGIENLLDVIMANGVTKFTRIYRPQLPIEKPKAASADNEEADEPVKEWEYLPFEVVFTGNKQSIAKVLNEITASSKYLYVFSSLRIKNEKDKPVSFGVAKKEEKQAKGGSGISLTVQNVGQPESPQDGAEPEKPAIPPREEILQQILGDEKIVVCMALNLVHFKQPASPEAEDSAEGTEE